MKMKIMVIPIVLLLLKSSAPVEAQNEPTQQNQQIVIPLSDPSKPGTLHVSLTSGSIRVTGYAGKEVVIEAGTAARRTTAETEQVKEKVKEKIKEKGTETGQSATSSSAGMRRIQTGQGLDLSAEQRNNVIRVETNSHHRQVNLTIRVPQRFALKLNTVNGGVIAVDNVTGELELNNVNGSIELSNISGSAVAHTVNGRLTANFRSVDGNAPMAFSTLNGQVDLTFPASTKANVKLKSDRGNIYSDFDVDVDKTQPKVTQSSQGQGGMYRVSVEDWVYGKINGGGPEVMVKTMMGSIYLRKAK